MLVMIQFSSERVVVLPYQFSRACFRRSRPCRIFASKTRVKRSCFEGTSSKRTSRPVPESGTLAEAYGSRLWQPEDQNTWATFSPATSIRVILRTPEELSLQTSVNLTFCFSGSRCPLASGCTLPDEVPRQQVGPVPTRAGRREASWSHDT